MKAIANLILVTLFIIIAGCILGAGLKAQSTDSIVINFDAQSAEATELQIANAIAKLDGKEVIQINGYANSLPNMTTKQANIDLAYDRAINVAYAIEAGYADLEATVVVSNKASDRRVVIYFEDYVVPAPAVSAKSVDSIQTNVQNDIAFDFDSVIDSSNTVRIALSYNAGVLSVDSISNAPRYVDTASFSEYELAIISQDVVDTISEKSFATNNKRCACDETADLAELWSNYKALQDSAQFYTHRISDEKYADNTGRDYFTYKATEMRVCWEQARKAQNKREPLMADAQLPRVVPVFAPAHAYVLMPNLGNTNKASSNKAKKSKSKKRRVRRPRGNGLAKMGFFKWLNMTLGTCF